MPSSRLEPLAPEQWDDRTRRILGGTVRPVAQLEGGQAAGSSRPLNILMTLAHHPSLLEPFLGFAATLAAQGVLPRRESELLALRTAWNCRSEFEWGHHVIYARASGLDEEEIRRVTIGPGAPAWSESDRALLAAADELHDCQDVSDATWARLRSSWNEAQLVEIPFVVGNYTMLSMVARATGVPLEPGLPAWPARDAQDQAKPSGCR
jgi:alkylhydroperoxidase family enzyme